MKRLLIRSNGQLGFSLLELLVTVAVVGIIAGMAVPLLKDSVDGIKLGVASRDVERELQTARLKAVTANQPVRVRFNCPNANEFRMVELIGTPAVPAAADSAVGRCALASFPYPPADSNNLTRPNHDGPLRMLESSVSFTAFDLVNGVTVTPGGTAVEFWPDGTAHVNTGTNPWTAINASPGYRITLTRNGINKTITVNRLGKVTIQ